MVHRSSEPPFLALGLLPGIGLGLHAAVDRIQHGRRNTIRRRASVLGRHSTDTLALDAPVSRPSYRQHSHQITVLALPWMVEKALLASFGCRTVPRARSIQRGQIRRRRSTAAHLFISTLGTHGVGPWQLARPHTGAEPPSCQLRSHVAQKWRLQLHTPNGG